jgi:hypothetical protein
MGVQKIPRLVALLGFEKLIVLVFKEFREVLLHMIDQCVFMAFKMFWGEIFSRVKSTDVMSKFHDRSF